MYSKLCIISSKKKDVKRWTRKNDQKQQQQHRYKLNTTQTGHVFLSAKHYNSVRVLVISQRFHIISIEKHRKTNEDNKKYSFIDMPECLAES